jgi:hypothetical protein
VAHRGVLWAASAEAPALTTPPGTLGTKFDTPGYKYQIWNLGTAFTHYSTPPGQTFSSCRLGHFGPIGDPRHWCRVRLVSGALAC